MCQAKPGRRCSADTHKRLETIKNTIQELEHNISYVTTEREKIHNSGKIPKHPKMKPSYLTAKRENYSMRLREEKEKLHIAEIEYSATNKGLDELASQMNHPSNKNSSSKITLYVNDEPIVTEVPNVVLLRDKYLSAKEHMEEQDQLSRKLTEGKWDSKEQHLAFLAEKSR